MGAGEKLGKTAWVFFMLFFSKFPSRYLHLIKELVYILEGARGNQILLGGGNFTRWAVKGVMG